MDLYIQAPAWMDVGFWLGLTGICIWISYFLLLFGKNGGSEDGSAAVFPHLIHAIDQEQYSPPIAAIPPEFELLSYRDQMRRFGRVFYHWQLERHPDSADKALLNSLSGSFRMKEIAEVVEIMRHDEDVVDHNETWLLRVRIADPSIGDRVYKRYGNDAWFRCDPLKK